MFYPPPSPTRLAEDLGSFQTAHTDVQFQTCLTFDDANEIPKEALLEAFKNGSGEIADSSILDQSTLSKTSFSSEDSLPTSADARVKQNGKACHVTTGKWLLCVMALCLAQIGIVEAAGQDQKAKTPRPSIAPTPSPQTKQNPGKSTTPEPTVSPTTIPKKKPTNSPTDAAPTNMPTNFPTAAAPTNSTSTPAANSTGSSVTYVPGNLTREEVGLRLSEGLRARIVAKSGKLVEYHNGSLSEDLFHGRPDYGATFADTRPFNQGGWVYASNSEMPLQGEGGVGSITFDKNGNVIDYRMVLTKTTMNCGGGKTPWETWISCEEVEFFGEIYQVDPFGELKAEKATIGSQLGRWESFAYDVRDPQDPKFFATEDHHKGTVRRFRPEQSMVDWDNPWDMLHVNGTIDYLIVSPNNNVTGGTFEWVTDLEQAKNNAREFYPQSEGIDIYDGQMYVTCKGMKQLFTFDLDEKTYFNKSTVSGLFDGAPDQMQRLILGGGYSLLYFTEEGGVDAGVHARDDEGRLYTVLESPVYTDETTGLAFSPDGRHMYVAYQGNGTLFDIWREDGLSFGGKTLNVKYHQTASTGGS